MLRLIHNQTIAGAILVDDIDDGLPNKEVHRLGSTADPKAYVRDGYAGKPKQRCYIPRVSAFSASVAGFITLNQTTKVALSAGKGKISKLQTAGLITVVSLLASDITAPTLATAASNTPSSGQVTLTGTGFISVAPDVTQVVFTGTGAVTVTATQITGAGGTVTATSIVVPASLIPSVAATVTSAKVVSNEQSTAVVALS